MNGIIEIAKSILITMNESKKFLNHLIEMTARDYINDLMTKDINNRYSIQDPTAYEKRNDTLAKRFAIYFKKRDFEGKQMENYKDNNLNIISEDEFKKNVMKCFNNNYKNLSPTLMQDALDDFIKKVHKELDG